MTTVVVFGATGSVASAAARTANDRGAKVLLASRSLDKPIPNLSIKEQRQSGYQRVKADLTNPETIRSVVTNAQATKAFIYTVSDTTDHMRASLEAMKAAGIEYVVNLSSFSVQADLDDITQENHIAYAHARVEANVAEIFGPSGYTSVRPAFFASNIGWWMAAASDGEVRMAYPEAKFDFIAPDDIGRVCGTLLTQEGRVTGTKNPLFLVGPEQLSLGNAVKLLGRKFGQELAIVEASEEEEVQSLVTKAGLPESTARSVVQFSQDQSRGNSFIDFVKCSDYVHNVQRITGIPSTRFQEWIQQAC